MPDRSMIEIIIPNVLANAVKFCRSGDLSLFELIPKVSLITIPIWNGLPRNPQIIQQELSPLYDRKCR